MTVKPVVLVFLRIERMLDSLLSTELVRGTIRCAFDGLLVVGGSFRDSWQGPGTILLPASSGFEPLVTYLVMLPRMASAFTAMD